MVTLPVTFIRLSTGLVVNTARIAVMAPCGNHEAVCKDALGQTLETDQHMHVIIEGDIQFAVSMEEYSELWGHIEKTYGVL